MFRRPHPIPLCLPLIGVLAVAGANPANAADVESVGANPDSAQPNILMIAVDDLNDWVEPLGGAPSSGNAGDAADR